MGVALQPLQVGAHIGGVLVTQIAVLLDCLIDHANALQLGRNLWIQLLGRGNGSRRIAVRISAELAPSNGSLPVAISYSTIPNYPMGADSCMHLHPGLFRLERLDRSWPNFSVDLLAREGLAVHVEQPI